MSGNGAAKRTVTEVQADLDELERQRSKHQAALDAAEFRLKVERIQVFRKSKGAAERQAAHKAARAEALEQLEQADLIQIDLELELNDAQQVEAEEDRRQHAKRGKQQADDLARIFRDLDAAMKSMVVAFRTARDEVDQARQRGYFRVGREQCDLLMVDCLHTGLQGMKISGFTLPMVDPMRRKTFTELGERWSAAMRGVADSVINGPPPKPAAPTPAVPSPPSTPEALRRRPSIHDTAAAAGQEVRIGRR